MDWSIHIKPTSHPGFDLLDSVGFDERLLLGYETLVELRSSLPYAPILLFFETSQFFVLTVLSLLLLFTLV
jgi:hypothetical protein